MKHRKLRRKCGIGGRKAIYTGRLLLVPLAIWTVLCKRNALVPPALGLGFVLWVALAVGGLACLYIGARDRKRSDFIGEVETFVLGAPVFGETLSLMCVIPTRRNIQIGGATALLYWDEVAVYQRPQGQERKQQRLLIAEHYAGDGAFQAGDVLRHEIKLLLPPLPPDDLWGANWRTAHKVSLVLQLSIDIEHCPGVREEYEVVVLEEDGNLNAYFELVGLGVGVY